MLRAVLLDFYGTLAEATRWTSAGDVLAEHGYDLADAVRDRFWLDDGIEHLEHSRSRDHYVAWQEARLLGMLGECDVHPGEYAVILEKLRTGMANRVLEAYDEVPAVLAALRDRGLRLAVCSNWDWDLAEAVEETGLRAHVDVLVSSAWVGARKPHPRIYDHTLATLELEPRDVLFVGDTWGPDVAGPCAMGMRAIYVRREGRWPDPGAPDDPAAEDVPVVSELGGLLELLEPLDRH